MKFLAVFCLALGLCLGAGLSFEVASVKAVPPADPTGPIPQGKRVDKAQVEYFSTTLGALMAEAYRIKPYQLSGPDWMSGMGAPRFDIEAKMPAGASEEQIPEMLRTLLAERFGLKVHRDSKERSFYALVVAKGGLKMQPAEANATGERSMKMNPDHQTAHLEFRKLNMVRLTELLGRMVDRPLVDMTGLKGDYQVALDLPVSALRPPAVGGEASDAGFSIFESVQKLGLKLETRKGPLETIVIDRLEKTPTEN
jgi:uncharacterized protein (TIGR03435 family)